MGGQSIVYVHMINGPFLFTKGGWVVKKGQNSVYVIIEWPLRTFQKSIIHASEKRVSFSLLRLFTRGG